MPTLLPRFTIDQPASLAEASDMLLSYGEDGRAYAGGTELLLAMKYAGLRYGHLVDIKTIAGLDAVRETDVGIEIGALSTHLAVERSPAIRSRLPVIATMESNVANPRVRCTGTMGGNLCFGEPHSDPATLLLCLDARVDLVGPTGERSLPLVEFITGAYDVALGEGELLRSISVPYLRQTQMAHYRKVQLHERPMLGLAMVLDRWGEEVAEARVAVGSASPTPTRCAEAEEMLTGALDAVRARLDDAAEALANAADLIDDLEGSAGYKRHLIHVELRRAFDSMCGG
ncbi:MAG: FAD binding domain-containing protein [Chloroflexota bacterium]